MAKKSNPNNTSIHTWRYEFYPTEDFTGNPHKPTEQFTGTEEESDTYSDALADSYELETGNNVGSIVSIMCGVCNLTRS